MAISSLTDSIYPSKRHVDRVKRTLASIETSFSVDASGLTPDWLEGWLALVDTPLEEYPAQLGLSMIAQLAGEISEAHTLMLSPPLPGEDWESRVRDCILTLSSHQRMVVAEYLRLRCDLADRTAQKAWGSLWADIFEARGDLSLAWKEPFATHPHLVSIRHRARERRFEEAVRSSFLIDPTQPTAELPMGWKGLGSTPPERYADELGLAMLDPLLFTGAPLPRMMLFPGFRGATQERVRDRILSLTSHQRMTVAEYLRLRYDLGDAQWEWGVFWRDVYEAGGDMSLVWEEPFAASPFPSRRHRARAKGVEKAIRSSFPIDSPQPLAALPEGWEGLADTPQEQYAGELGSAMVAQLQDPFTSIEKMMLIPHQRSILDTLKPAPAQGYSTAEQVRDRILSLTPHQRVVVAEYLKFRGDIGDGPAQQAWTCLWRDIYEAGGEMSLVW